VVVITQRPAVLNSMDKVLILRAGRMEALGLPSEVLLRVVRSAPPRVALPANAERNGSEPSTSAGLKESNGAPA
jgi:ATP-binding cassette subfamily C protein